MFGYLIEKIRDAEFNTEPFKHLRIKSFLSDEHFNAIVSSGEINLSPQVRDEDLFGELFSKGYKIIGFPGCITNKDEYLEWHQEKKSLNGRNNPACEGFGITLRLAEPKTDIIRELKSFLEAEEFNAALAEKFGLPFEETRADNGIQKYLDGYEISPHPDVRRKALTYMVNINPHQNAEGLNHHTHYLKFKNRYNYVKEFWTGNPDLERCWVPWTWCDTIAEQRDNNSVVIFSPSNDTLHAVKASYDHLKGQRTQLYGNLWYKERHCGIPSLEWKALDVVNANKVEKTSLLSKVKSVVPRQIKDSIKATLGSKKSSDVNVMDRKF